MNGELIWVLSLLLIAIILFATGKVRMDAVALFVIVAFVLSGTLTLPEAFSGFSDPNVILIAALSLLTRLHNLQALRPKQGLKENHLKLKHLCYIYLKGI